MEVAYRGFSLKPRVGIYRYYYSWISILLYVKTWYFNLQNYVPTSSFALSTKFSLHCPMIRKAFKYEQKRNINMNWIGFSSREKIIIVL